MTFGLKQLDKVPNNMEIPLTVEDLYQAATTMNLNKASGIDGLTLEFYLKFWPLMGPVLYKWFEHLIKEGKLSGISSIGVIMLIPKAGDLRLKSNWRPINLLTVDLKIICKAIANKITPIISEILPQNQTALPGNSIFTSLNIVRDIIYIAKHSKNPLMILALDQAKAYDRVNHSFLFHLLQCVNIPGNLMTALKAIYTGFKCVIKNGSILSKPFNYERGIRQGDATSTVLFALALQPFLNAAQTAFYEQGFRLQSGENILYTAYADDLTFFVKSVGVVQGIIETFNYIAEYSGAALNIDKSSILIINPQLAGGINFIRRSLPLPISTTSIKILGVDFSPSLRISHEQWNQKLLLTCQIIAKSFTKLKSMTFCERASWAKIRLWPPWSFLCKVLQPTEQQMDQLNSVFSHAIWLNGKHWLAQQQTVLSKFDGGLDAMSPKLRIDSFRIMFLARLCAQPLSSHSLQLAVSILQSYAGLKYGLEILHIKFDKNYLISLPSFYAKALEAWNLLPICIFPTSVAEINAIPAVNSRLFFSWDEPFSIPISVALSMNIRSVGDLYYSIPSVTRLSQNLIGKVRAVVDSMQLNISNGLDIPNNFKNTQQYIISETSVLCPSFWLISGDSFLHFNKWTNKIIFRTLRSLLEVQTTELVSRETWSILYKIDAPSPFINAMWRFLHQKYNSPTLYFHMGLINSKHCVLCKSGDVTRTHQFKECKILDLLKNILHTFISKMNLQPLGNMSMLYDHTSMDHVLANFVLTAYVYSVMYYTKCVVNDKIQPTSEGLLRTFFKIIHNHFRKHASYYPPGDLSVRQHWDILTHVELLAYFKDNQLYIYDGASYIPFVDI